jgi:uncharacterized membrane protein YkgB
MQRIITPILSRRYHLLSASIGIAYLWFGILKFFPGLSPAEKLAQETITHITFGLVPSHVSIHLLAVWESILGIFLIMGKMNKAILVITLVHMSCTFMPFVFMPEQSFNSKFFFLTLVGQYIMKNVIIIFAMMVLYEKSKAERYVRVRK